MKKLTAFLAAAAIISTVSCAKGTVSESDIPVETITVSQTMYKEERGSLPDDYISSECLGYCEGSGIRLVYDNRERGYSLAEYDENGNISSFKELVRPDGLYTARFDIGDDGSITMLAGYAHSQYELYTEEFFNDAELTFEIRRFSADGAEEGVIDIDISEYFSFPDDFIQNIQFIAGKYIITTNNTVLMLDENGAFEDAAEMNDHIYYCEDAEGRLIAASSKGFAYIDEIKPDITEEMTEYGKYLSLQQGISKGYDGFKAFFMLNNGIYGLTESGEVIEVMNYINSLMTCGDYYELTYAGKGKFAAIGADDSSTYLSVMTVRPDDYVMDRKEVMIGYTEYSFYDELSTMYNKKSDRFVTKAKRYDDLDSLKADILSGASPDVYFTNDCEDIYKLANMGAACDMYELSEKYGGLKKDDIMENVRNAFEYKGGLYMMSQNFSVYSLYGLSSFFDSPEISVSDFKTIVDTMPDDMYLANCFVCRDPEKAFELLVANNIGQFIDYEKAECHFDSQDLLDLLEITRSVEYAPFPDLEAYDAAGDMEGLQAFEENERLRVKNGTALVGDTHYIASFYDIRRFEQYSGLSNEDYVFLAPPSSAPSGLMSAQRMFAVLNSGNCTEGGWDLVNYLLSDDLLTSYLQTESSFVTTRSAFEKILDHERYISENPVEILPDGQQLHHLTYLTEDERPVPLSDEEIAKYRQLISSANSLSGSYEQVKSIAQEEFAEFAAGETDAATCAERIQNRVTIYLSENS